MPTISDARLSLLGQISHIGTRLTGGANGCARNPLAAGVGIAAPPTVPREIGEGDAAAVAPRLAAPAARPLADNDEGAARDGAGLGAFAAPVVEGAESATLPLVDVATCAAAGAASVRPINARMPERGVMAAHGERKHPSNGTRRGRFRAAAVAMCNWL